MTNDDPETAERLVAILTPLITEQSCGEWDDKTINEDVQMFLPPLLAALQEARNAALREAANIVRGEVYRKHYRTWVIWPPYDDPPQERPNVSENHGKARHCDQLADAILTLIDTPAPPVEPAGDALREALADIARQKKTTELETEYDVECADFEGGYDMCIDVARAALVTAPAPIQPAPQPNADEREAMVVAMSKVIRDNIAIEWAEAKTVADALLAAGWTRKREADVLIEAERRGAERMRERAAAIADQFDAKRFYETYRAEYNRKRYDVAGVERMQRKALNIQAENARDAIRALPLTEETCDADA